MNQTLTLEQIQHMSTDDIVNAYRSGYVLEENISNTQNLNPKIVSAQGITISTGSLLLLSVGILAYMYIRATSIDNTTNKLLQAMKMNSRK